MRRKLQHHGFHFLPFTLRRLMVRMGGAVSVPRWEEVTLCCWSRILAALMCFDLKTLLHIRNKVGLDVPMVPPLAYMFVRLQEVLPQDYVYRLV